MQGQKQGFIKTILFLSPVLMGVVLVAIGMFLKKAQMATWQQAAIAFVCWVLGVVLLFKAKFRTIRESKITFGMAALDTKEKRFYVSAYLLVALGVCVVLF